MGAHVTMNDLTWSAQGLAKWYGQVIALNDVSFEIQAPIVGLLGPNGAGKSSLIRLLTGQLRPSKGRVSVMGQAPFGNRMLLARMGYCPEHDRFYEQLTAYQFLEMLTRLYGVEAAGAARLADEALSRLDLTKQRDQVIFTLSHGMRQRLKVAQALAHQPDWLVLDEPFSGMDPIGRAKMIRLLRQQAEGGCRILLSSHVLHELEAVTSDILLLHQGRLLAKGMIQSIRRLIDEHPHRIALTAKNPRELGRELLKYEDVARVEIENDSLVVETRSPDACYDRIGELALAGGFQIKSMLSLDDNLESVFRYLVK